MVQWYIKLDLAGIIIALAAILISNLTINNLLRVAVKIIGSAFVAVDGTNLQLPEYFDRFCYSIIQFLLECGPFA